VSTIWRFVVFQNVSQGVHNGFLSVRGGECSKEPTRFCARQPPRLPICALED
jgi:hypothetical protein